MEPDSPRSRFGERARAYVTSPVHAAPAELELLMADAMPAAHWRALDVATGGGHTALALSRRVAGVVASDLTPEMAAAARRHLAEQGAANVSFAVAAAEALPFGAGTFDLVTCRIAPHHFADVAAFLAGSARVLRPGGVLVVQDHVLPEDKTAAGWIDDFEWARDPSHRHAHSRQEWHRLFSAAGFTVRSAREIEKRHQLVQWAERQGADPALLRAMLEAAPPAVAAWLAPEHLDAARASFVNRHLVITGAKAG